MPPDNASLQRARLFAWWALFAHALAWLLAAPGTAHAQVEPMRSWPQRAVSADFWVDNSGNATLAQAQAQFAAERGRPVDFARAMPFGSGRAVWYRLRLPQVDAAARAVLTVPFPGMDFVELYRPDGQGGWDVQRAGDSIPVAQWPTRHVHPAFAFTLQPNEAQPTFLRMRHSHAIAPGWVLWDAAGFAENAKLVHMGIGGLAGCVLLVVLLSIANAVSWRDSVHLYYALHVLIVGLALLVLNGFAGEYLWPDNAWWTDMAAVVFPPLAVAWMGLFVQALVAERGRRRLDWLLVAHVALGAGLALWVLVNGRNEAVFQAQSLYIGLGLPLMAAVLGWHASRHSPSTWWVFAGVALMALGAGFPVLRNLNLLPVNFATQNGPQIAWALEIPLVLIGLLARSRARRDSRMRFHALAHTDALTGVASPRVLAARLGEQLRRDEDGAVLRVHIANLDTIRSEHGREAAEAAVVRAAECIAREAKVNDVIGREPGGDLVLLLKGQVTRDAAAMAGRNIIARGLKPSRLLPPGVVLALSVVAACKPMPSRDPEELLGVLARNIAEIAAGPGSRPLRVLEAARMAEPAPAIVR
jgi:GGDEF domain-containing protein